MGTTLKQLIALLNKDLELEYSAMIQYIQHSGVIRGVEWGVVKKDLKVHAEEELQHRRGYRFQSNPFRKPLQRGCHNHRKR